MKTILTLALILLSVRAGFAQEQQVNGTVQYDHSPETGHQDGIGARAELVLALADRWRLVTTSVFSYEPKAYLGNGWGTRFGSEVRYRLIEREDVTPFLDVGLALSNNTTSTYSKTAWFLTAGGGVSLSRDKYVLAYRHFFREHHTANKVSSDLVEFTAYLPLSADSKWRIVAGGGLQRTSFTQPTGVAAGQRVAWSYRVIGGVGRVF